MTKFEEYLEEVKEWRIAREQLPDWDLKCPAPAAPVVDDIENLIGLEWTLADVHALATYVFAGAKRLTEGVGTMNWRFENNPDCPADGGYEYRDAQAAKNRVSTFEEYKQKVEQWRQDRKKLGRSRWCLHCPVDDHESITWLIMSGWSRDDIVALVDFTVAGTKQGMFGGWYFSTDPDAASPELHRRFEEWMEKAAKAEDEQAAMTSLRDIARSS
jgi:hypothetical protein